MKINFTYIKTFLLFVCISSLSSCKEENKAGKLDGYTISGTVKGLESAWVKLVEINYNDIDNKTVIDSVKMVNGTFKFTGKVASPDKVDLLIDSKYSSVFFIENSAIKLELDIAKAKRGDEITPKVFGSKSQDLFDEFIKKQDSVMNQEKFTVLGELRAEMVYAYKSKNDEVIKKYREKAANYKSLKNEQYKERANLKYQYVKNNPSSAVATYALGFQFNEGKMSKDEMKEVYPIFKGEATKTAMYKYFSKTYKEIFETLGVGSVAPDFTLNTIEGEKLTLSDVKGKYILVDFWASWCAPCRASFPHLKELEKKYGNDGFVIVGVGTADEEKKWRKAIEEDQTTWNHVYDKSENHKYGPVAKLYGVPFLPTTFLIDSERKIILRNPKGDELNDQLKELYGY